jgi:fatty acid desaturase
MFLEDRKDYFKTLSPQLSEVLNKTHPAYLFLFAIYGPIVAFCGYEMIAKYLPWYTNLILAIIAGLSMGGLMLLGHEISHRTVIKSKKLIWILSTLCMAQYGMTGTVWDRWHNRLHHTHTQVPFEDPDSWGYEKLYQFSRYLRMAFKVSPGSNKIGSIFFLFIYFSWQSFMSVFLHPKVLTTVAEKCISRLFYVSIYTAWIGITLYLGLDKFVLLFLIPLAFSNLTMMMYISTNHFISRINPLEGPNDTLVNTLSVSVPKWMDFLHLNISHHVEHHLFPYVSSHYYPKIKEIVMENYPTKYKCLPLLVALKRVYSTPRFYSNTYTLIHPETKKTVPTIQ